MSDDKKPYSVSVPIGPAKPPSEESKRLAAERAAKEKHGTDTVTITEGRTRGGNVNIDYTDNHGNRINYEGNNGFFARCNNNAQISEADMRAAVEAVKDGKRADYRILTGLGITDEAYDFKGPNPIENVCRINAPSKGK